MVNKDSQNVESSSKEQIDRPPGQVVQVENVEHSCD